MQWIALYTKQDAYFPRTPGERVRLTVLAINIEADTRQRATIEALKIAWHKLEGWVLVDVMLYEPEVHDNLLACEEVVGGGDGRDAQKVNPGLV